MSYYRYLKNANKDKFNPHDGWHQISTHKDFENPMATICIYGDLFYTKEQAQQLFEIDKKEWENKR